MTQPPSIQEELELLSQTLQGKVTAAQQARPPVERRDALVRDWIIGLRNFLPQRTWTEVDLCVPCVLPDRCFIRRRRIRVGGSLGVGWLR